MATPKDVLAMAKEEGAEIVDYRFCDLPGLWQHFSVPASEMTDDLFDDGIGFDGSSIRGYQQIQEKRHAADPDPETAYVDPVLEVPTLSMICNVLDPVTREPYTRDPRHIAQKAEAYLKQSGIADISYWGPEAEFYIFDDVRFDQNAQEGYYHIDSVEGVWNTGRQEEARTWATSRGTRKATSPARRPTSFQDLRSEMILNAREGGRADRGPPPRGRHRRPGRDRHAVRPAHEDGRQPDVLQVHHPNVGRKHGKTATFMPKPIFGDNGSGMHCHQSLWKGETNLFWDEKGYGQISEMARHYIGGLLKHAPALLALCARPPTRTAGSCPATRRRSTSCTPSATGRRACGSRSTPRARSRSGSSSAAPTRRATRTSPSPPCSWPASTASRTRSTRASPIDKDLYDLEPAEEANGQEAPGSLGEVLDALESDHALAAQGRRLHAGRDRDLDHLQAERGGRRHARCGPHPYEFHLYYDL